MIDGDNKRHPSWTSGVAGFADICGDRMGGRFIRRVSARMTGGASVRGLGMIEWQYKRKPTGI